MFLRQYIRSIVQHPSYVLFCLLSIVAAVYATIYSRILFAHPFIAGSDVIYHTWFTQQILDFHTIPLTQPTQSTPSIYVLTPFFHLITAAISKISFLPLLELMPWLTATLFVVFILSLGYLAFELTNRKGVAIISIVLYFFLQTEFFEYLPRNMAIVEFLLLAIFVSRYFKSKTVFSVRHIIGIGIFSILLVFTHLFVAAFALAIVLSASIGYLIFLKKRSKVFVTIGIFIFSVGLLFLRLQMVPDLQSLSLSQSNQSTFLVTTAVLTKGSAPSILDLTEKLWIIFFAIGLFLLLRQWRSYGPSVANVLLCSWLICGYLFYIQSIGGYNFLPDRSRILVQPVVMIICSLGLLFLNKIYTKKNILLVAAILIVCFVSSSTSYLSPGYLATKNGISRAEVQEYQNIHKVVPNGRIASDPITTYMLTSMSGMSSGYQFDHTNLTVARFSTWPEVHAMFSSSDKTFYTWLAANNVKYFVISYHTASYIANAKIERVTHNPRFTLLYQSSSLSATNGLPYFSIFRYDGAN